MVQITYANVAEGVVSSSSTSQLSFTVSELGPPPVALLEEFTLRVGNRGNALMAFAKDADRRFALLPVISDLSPYRGSLGGGTLVTITGSGFATSTTDVVVSWPSLGLTAVAACLSSLNARVVCFLPASCCSHIC